MAHHASAPSSEWIDGRITIVYVVDLIIRGQAKHAVHLGSMGRGVVYLSNLTTTMEEASSVMLSPDTQ